MTTASLDKKQCLSLYRTMLLIRRTEERLSTAHQRGLVHGACHTYIGQEAVAAGVCAHLDAEDVVFSTHRGHGHALAKGLPIVQLFAELYGRASGCSRGRGGSMHLFAPEIGLMGTSGIVASSILQATGAGYSFMLLKSSHVAVAFFGDGAVSNGAFHEGLNMAAVWNLPVLFVCENNQYATEIAFQSVTGNTSVGSRAQAYAMPGISIDGNDVLAVYEATGEAVSRARAGHGPTLLECRTYRTRPHAEGMGDFTYRTRAEVEEWKDRCPINQLALRMQQGNLATAKELGDLDTALVKEIEAADRQAQASPWPEPATATAHVYAEPARRIQSEVPAGSKREITFTEATLEALSHEMAHNPGIFVLGLGIGKRGGNFKTTTGLFDIYGPERLRDTPISERGFVGLGGGAAMTGTRPVIDFMFADFILDAVGEIVNQIAKMQYMSNGRLKMPILLRGCIGISHSLGTHHSGSYYSLYAHCPGLRVVVPSCPADAKGLLHHALRSDDPVLFLEHRELLGIKGPVPEAPYEIPFGKAAVVREGSDATVVALGVMVERCRQACDQLTKEGISAELIDPRTVSPLDTDTVLKSVARTGRLLIVEEEFGPCGIGAEIAAQVAARGFDQLKAPIHRLNGAWAPTPYSPPLEAAVVPQVDAIAKAMRDLLNQAQVRRSG